ncbi:MAG: hypothetical protein L3J92_05065 [Thermoplasmata archaeon]|nr:hypothetical protein [Thermoplasmata archaeon]
MTSYASINTNVILSNPGNVGLEKLLNVTGNVATNGLTNRTPWVNAVQYWGVPYGPNSTIQNVSGSDPTSPSEFSASDCPLYNFQVHNNSSDAVNMTVSGSFTTSSGVSFSLTLGGSVGLGDGIGSINTGVSIPVSLTSGGTVSSSEGVHVAIAKLPYLTEWDVCYQGDDSVTDGVTVHAWLLSG